MGPNCSKVGVDMKLNDEVIAHVAKLLQLAILTGTDIVDHMRLIRLVQGKDDELILDLEYSKNAEVNIQKMLDDVDELTGE